MTLKEYWKLLSRHDWFFQFSDDPRAFEAGHIHGQRLHAIANLSEEHAALYRAWGAHVFSGKPWSTNKLPKPQEPSE